MSVGVGRDFQEVSFFGELGMKKRVMVGFAVVGNVAVQNIGKDERRRPSTYQLNVLASESTGFGRQSTYYDRLNLLRGSSSRHGVQSI